MILWVNLLIVVMSKRNIFFLIIGLLVLGALATVSFQFVEAPAGLGKYDEFAKCITSENLTMYGAKWCSHCNAEKARFGDSFKYVPYVECTKNPNLCLQKGVEGFPTWIDKNGKKYIGEQGLEKLSKISNCELPTD